MSPLFRKSKTISFRLSPEEYRVFQDACNAQGIRSLSDLARTAMHRLIVSSVPVDGLSEELRSLKDRLEMISIEVNRLSQSIVRKGAE